MRDYDNLFGEYYHLKSFPREADALYMLRKAASCVKPIMRKRGWRVGRLSEFFPEQSNLLGLNIDQGRAINLRLRHAVDHTQFLGFEQVLDTLLHELCHNWIGPHNTEFNKLWEELRDEWTTLQIKGFSGEGFLGRGEPLGGKRVPLRELQRRAHAAAIERTKQNKGADLGRRLGGRDLRGPDVRSVIADAAQRRKTVTSSCGTGNKAAERAAEDALLNGFRTKEEMDEANEIAIQEATFELMELEEERKLAGEPGSSSPPIPSPTIEGLTWSPEYGLQPVQTPQSRSAPPQPPPLPPPSMRDRVPPPPMHDRVPPHGRVPPHDHVPPPPIQRPVQPPPIPVHSRPEVNTHGRPISRLVREAEEKSKSRLKKPLTASSSSVSLSNSHQPSTSDEAWQCLVCTLINIASATQCDVCESPKPDSVKSALSTTTNANDFQNASFTSSKPLGWNCVTCGTFMDTRWWTCSNCGTVKASS